MSWKPIETAPPERLVVVGWIDKEGNERYDFDFLEDGVWFNYENFLEWADCVGKPEDVPCTMPSKITPYQYWMELPELPK